MIQIWLLHVYFKNKLKVKFFLKNHHKSKYFEYNIKANALHFVPKKWKNMYVQRLFLPNFTSFMNVPYFFSLLELSSTCFWPSWSWPLISVFVNGYNFLSLEIQISTCSAKALLNVCVFCWWQYQFSIIFVLVEYNFTYLEFKYRMPKLA